MSRQPPTGNLNHRLWMYRVMVTSREFEKRLKTIYFEGKTPVFNMGKGTIPGEMHLSIGQEPCAVGVCAHLRPADFVTATHRPHHVAIAKGVDLNAMAAEIFGKQTGLSGGRGGHMHLFDAKVSFSCSGIVGQGMAPAVGAAISAKMKRTDNVAVSFIGDGAANQGLFHESLNLAAVWKAPVVFVIEDNAYGISVAKSVATAIPRNADRAVAYGIPGIFVPGNDPDAIHEVAGKAIARARSGEGPTLIEIETHRLDGHYVGDTEGYRPPEEMAKLKDLDPIELYRQRLERDGHEPGELQRLAADATVEVEAAIAFARQSPYPAIQEAFTHVYG